MGLQAIGQKLWDKTPSLVARMPSAKAIRTRLYEKANLVGQGFVGTRNCILRQVTWIRSQVSGMENMLTFDTSLLKGERPTLSAEALQTLRPLVDAYVKATLEAEKAAATNPPNPSEKKGDTTDVENAKVAIREAVQAEWERKGGSGKASSDFGAGAITMCKISLGAAREAAAKEAAAKEAV